MEARKRCLSDSSTGSEDATFDHFKRPKVEANNQSLPPYHPIHNGNGTPKFERRESQASTASSSLSCSEDDDAADIHGRRLLQALDSSETDEEPQNSPSFQPKPASLNEPGQYSSAAAQMMAKMGYKSGAGLGKSGQGRVEPVELSKQRGRRGLGMIIKSLEDNDAIDWEAEKEHIEIEERVKWMPSIREPCPNIRGQ